MDLRGKPFRLEGKSRENIPHYKWCTTCFRRSSRAFAEKMEKERVRERERCTYIFWRTFLTEK